MTIPTVLVRSLRAQHRSATIIQCSDEASPTVEGVDRVQRLEGDPALLMTFRLRSFATLGLAEPTMYLDTDMICVKPLDPAKIIGAADVAVCRREYDRDLTVNTNFRGMDLSSYSGRTLDQAWPFIACCTVARNFSFWVDCARVLEQLDRKWWSWYGDQEAIREVIASGKYRTVQIPETVYGNQARSRQSSAPRLLHFKGAEGKKLILAEAARRGLIPAHCDRHDS